MGKLKHHRGNAAHPFQRPRQNGALARFLPSDLASLTAGPFFWGTAMRLKPETQQRLWENYLRRILIRNARRTGQYLLPGSIDWPFTPPY